MELTLSKNVSKVVHFTHFFLRNNNIFMISKIQTMRKLNNPTITPFAVLFLTLVRFNLLE